MPPEEGGGPTLGERIAELRTNFRPPARRTSSGLSGTTDGGNSDGVAVRVVVRCRPQTTAARAANEPIFGISTEAAGKGRSMLRFAVADEAWDRLAAAEDGNGGRAAARGSRSREVRAFRCNAYLGPDATQEDVFREAAPIVENVMEGYNGTIFCYGVTGSGKTYTMSGPPEDIGKKQREAASIGVMQRVSRRIFEYIRDRSMKGEVFLVEASFLEIYSSDGAREQLIDLLGQEERKLEVKQDPANRESFVCDGLRRLPIRTPDELCEVLNAGQQRCNFMETTKNCHSSRSHCLFILTIESLDERQGNGQPLVQRGKLMLVDLAGSESLKRVHAANDSKEELRQKQAIGINRVLTSLGTVVNNLNMGRLHGHRDSALTMLLRDCLGGNARALLVANIGPELGNMDESAKTMTFAQQMMAVRNHASVNRIEKEQSSLLQMRQRHTDCIRILQEKVTDSREDEQEAAQKLRQEMEELNQRLLTKESAERTLEGMREEQLRKIDEMRNEMAKAMSRELEKMRMQSQQDLDNLRQSMEQHVSTVDESQQTRNSEEHQVRVGKMQAEVHDAAHARRAAEEEAADLRVRLASAEERSKMLQARQEELRHEREGLDEERRQLRQKGEQQWQSLLGAENELQRCKAEVEVQRTEVERLHAARTKEEEDLRAGREAWRQREAELQKEVSELRGRVEETRRGAEVQALRADSDYREAAAVLRLQVERLHAEAASRAEQLARARQAGEQLEADKAAALEREQTMRQQASVDLQLCQEDLDEARLREDELMHMLREVQDSIFTGSNDQPAGTS